MKSGLEDEKALGAQRIVSKARSRVVCVPEWSQWSWLRAGFSTRDGGRSSVYAGDAEPGEQNLGWTKEDDPAIVAENRGGFLEAVLGETSLPLVTIRQVHSGNIETVSGPANIAAASLMTADGQPVLRGDGLMTDAPGLLLGILTADCVPVLLADTRQHAVAALHAGWRGTLARIVERGVELMQLQFGTRPEEIVAAIGPGIGACCFAVGDDVRCGFEGQFAYAPELFRVADVPGQSKLQPQMHLDLIETNRRQLLDAGVPGTAISSIGECTACTRLEDGRRKYFSHRGEHGYTGRMLSVVGAVE